MQYGGGFLIFSMNAGKLKLVFQRKGGLLCFLITKEVFSGLKKKKKLLVTSSTLTENILLICIQDLLLPSLCLGYSLYASIGILVWA